MKPGTRLGPYTVLSAIGKGGMGEVWRARDTRLEREVALKVLPEAFTRDQERLARFEREARLLAAVSHPNVAALLGIEESTEIKALVLELVPGPTIADRIAERALPVEEAIEIARQIALALEAAHAAGIVHRDLKPGNVKLRGDALVKVLDFGLAKALDPGEAPEAAADPANSTLPAGGTATGVILGTAAYMSPEQARGRTVDRRCDVWAFGVLLYEMLTGRRAFPGEDVSDTIASVLRDEPDWTQLPVLPPGVRQTLGACLKKEARRRPPDMTTIRLMLEGELESDERAAAEAGVRERPVARALLALPPALRLPSAGDGATSAVRLSPDGRHVVLRAREGESAQLYLRSLDRLEVEPIAGTEGVGEAFTLSPDGLKVAFHVPGRQALLQVPLGEGTPLTIARIGSARDLSWSVEGRLAISGVGAGLVSVPEGGGAPEPLTRPGAEGEVHAQPSFLPDGRALVFTIEHQSTTARAADCVGLVELGQGETHVLCHGRSPSLLGNGVLVFTCHDPEPRVSAAPFDLRRRALTGHELPVLPDVQLGIGARCAHFSVGACGSLVYVRRSFGAATPVWVDREGREERMGEDTRRANLPRASPGGDRLAFLWDYPPRVHVRDLVRGTDIALTSSETAATMPVWRADGREIVFSSLDGGVYNLSRVRADGAGEVERLTTGPRSQYATSWSTDMRWVLCYAVDGGELDLWALDLDAGSTRALVSGERATFGALSPDGQWFAYQSAAPGRSGIYLRPFSDPEAERVTVATDGGVHPRWSPDGRELFYWREGVGLMAVSVELGATPRLGTSRTLFPVDGYLFHIGRNYDVAPDGERFVMIQDRSDPPAIVWVQNWAAELERLFGQG